MSNCICITSLARDRCRHSHPGYPDKCDLNNNQTIIEMPKVERETMVSLLQDFIKNEKSTASELGEIKATMIANFNGSHKELPKLIDGTEPNALTMFLKIMDHYLHK